MTAGVGAAASRALATGSGLLMAVSATAGARGPTDVAATAAGAVAVAAVLVGLLIRPMATAAVVSTVAVIVLGDPAPEFAALSGLCAAVYLLLRHTRAVTTPTLLAVVGFTLVGVVTTMAAPQLPWLPLLAPPLAFVCYVLAVGPFFVDRD